MSNGYKYMMTQRARVQTVLEYPRRAHSAKPPTARQLIERTSPGPYLEMFARQAAPGWDVWGNELPNSIELGERAVAVGEQQFLF